MKFAEQLWVDFEVEIRGGVCSSNPGEKSDQRRILEYNVKIGWIPCWGITLVPFKVKVGYQRQESICLVSREGVVVVMRIVSAIASRREYHDDEKTRNRHVSEN